MHLVVAAAAPDVVGARAALDQVVARSLALDGLGAGFVGVQRERGLLVAVHLVVARTAVEGVVAGTADDLVALVEELRGARRRGLPDGHTGDVVAAVHLVDAAVAVELVALGAAVDQVVERAAVQLVDALAAVEPVVALLAEVGRVLPVAPGLVGAVADVDGVVAAVALDRVVARATDEVVVADRRAWRRPER